jgi:hypothetical protein
MRTALPLAPLVLMLLALRPAPSAPPPRDSPTDRAIDAGLAFLANTQDKNDGGWRLNGQPSAAITGLCVMAFLSAGHVPGEGRYGPAVERGVRFLLKCQRPDGLIGAEGGTEMYHHGIAVLALSEAAGMLDGPLGKQVREAIKKGVAVILRAQRTDGPDRGGWRYAVTHELGSDMSVTGWQLLALRAARNVGCDVPPEAIDKALAFVMRCQDPSGGGFRYTTYGGVTSACTGTGILALELGGKGRHHSPEALKAGAWLLRNPPADNQPHFFYTTYYAAQALFQLGDEYWEAFRPRLRDLLLRRQHDNGSWSVEGSDGWLGPNYCTALAVLALTVEYRFLPIYQRGEEPAPKMK